MNRLLQFDGIERLTRRNIVFEYIQITIFLREIHEAQSFLLKYKPFYFR